MGNKILEDIVVKEAKKELGTKITECRKELAVPLSMRKFAEAIEIPPSNIKYIEDGINAPSHDVYARIIKVLKPPPDIHAKMDKLYTIIRKSPPPDVCDTINNNQDLFDVIRIFSDQILTTEQISKAKILFETFANENKGE